jgi:catechol 2,3-dioxygenase-like lactoylglutathione lyase family enzyme
VFAGVNHICVVTGDLDRAVRTWADRYGVGPWSVWTKDASNMTARVDGEPAEFAMRVALAPLASGARIELIQPLDDRSPYARSLERRGRADHIHHVRFDVADHDAAVARLGGELGLQETLHAEFDGTPGDDAKFIGTYFDTEDDLGFVVEVGHAAAGFAMPEPERVYPESTSPAASSAVSSTASPP